jgi:hypothetical protein
MVMASACLRFAAAVVMFVLSAATMGAAAEIRLGPSSKGSAGAVLEGKLETGDFDKFKAFILKGDNPVELYLASPGGNLTEAMKIGLLVRLLKLSTVVPSKTLTNQSRNLAIARHGLKDPKANYVCSSACFFIFVGGIYRSTDDMAPPILGIHRPFLPGNDVKALSMNNTTAMEDRIRKTVENYLEAMDVPAKYSENMFSVPKGKILWIRDDEFKTDFEGFVPQLKDWVNTKCAPLIARDQTKGSCEEEVRNELALRAYSDTIKKRNSETPQISH